MNEQEEQELRRFDKREQHKLLDLRKKLEPHPVELKNKKMLAKKLNEWKKDLRYFFKDQKKRRLEQRPQKLRLERMRQVKREPWISLKLKSTLKPLNEAKDWKKELCELFENQKKRRLVQRRQSNT